MRIWRTVLAPAILTIGTVGALVAGPVLALTTAAAPVNVAAGVSATPNIIVMHGSITAPTSSSCTGDPRPLPWRGLPGRQTRRHCASIACAGNGAPPIDQSAARRSRIGAGFGSGQTRNDDSR